MEKHEIAVNLKAQLDVPVVVENDVKSMMMGVQADNQYESLAYVYMSQTGVGSAYYLNQQILKGNQAFSGELGLLPYQQPFMAVLEDICVQLFMTIALTIDPKQIIVAGPRLSSLSLSHIKEKIQTYLSLRYQLDIDISQDLISDGLNGLHYMGILRLFDIYTNYEKQTWKWIKNLFL